MPDILCYGKRVPGSGRAINWFNINVRGKTYPASPTSRGQLSPPLHGSAAATGCHAKGRTAFRGLTASRKLYAGVTSGCVINVSGQHFEIYAGLLLQHPHTLLGNRRKRRPFYDRKKEEFFFDRHRPSFEAVFAYYQYGGKLKRPTQVPDDVFLAEVQFYQIEPDIVDEYRRSEGYMTREVKLPTNATLRKIWLL